ncbi:MAG: hypothetical protein CMP58_03520 [Flavobacteriales bacterium]|nr:hypothetical protein [Flavobacteriales bacterium]
MLRARKRQVERRATAAVRTLEVERRQPAGRVRRVDRRAIALQPRARDLALVDQILEVQIVKRVDAPLVDHLVAQRVLVVGVRLLEAPLDVVGVDLHQPLHVAGLARVDVRLDVLVELGELGHVLHALDVGDLRVGDWVRADDARSPVLRRFHDLGVGRVAHRRAKDHVLLLRARGRVRHRHAIVLVVVRRETVLRIQCPARDRLQLIAPPRHLEVLALLARRDKVRAMSQVGLAERVAETLTSVGPADSSVS